MASVLIPCPRCGKGLRLRDRSLLGRRGKCPGCQHRFVLQEPEEVELELADAAPAVGTSPRWVPEESEASAATPSHDSARPVSPASERSSATPPDADSPPIAETFSAPGGIDRLREIKRRNARRRNMGIVVGGVVTLAAAGLLFALHSIYFGTEEGSADAGPKRPQVDVAYQQEKKALQANVERAQALSPTRGEPIRLLFVPTGAHVVLHLRPAELWQTGTQGEEFRYCLGPLADWAEANIRELCLFEPAEIEELLFGLIYRAPGETPHVCAVVRLVEEPKRSELLMRFQGEPNREFDHPVYVGREYTYLIDSEDLRTFALAPNELAGAAEDMVTSMTSRHPLPTDIGIEELLRSTDRERHLTVMFRPDDVRVHQDGLVPGMAGDFVDHVVAWFDPQEIETVAWSLHLGEKRFHSEVLLRNRTAVPAARLQRELRKRLDMLPHDVLAAVEKMDPREAGKRRVIGRFPAMTKVFSMATEPGISDRFVQLTTMLPERAAPNLALGTLLTWDESTRTDFSREPVQTPSSEPSRPDRIADRLRQSIDVEFSRTPLEAAFRYIGEETKVRFEIDGDALMAAGMTRNMPQDHELGVVPATQAIHAILSQYEQEGMIVVVDEEAQTATVTTQAAAEEKGWEPFELAP